MSVRHLEALLQPRRIAVLGDGGSSALAQRCLDNLQRSLPPDRRFLVGGERSGWTCLPADAVLPACEAVVLLDPAGATPLQLEQWFRQGCRALVAIDGIHIEQEWLLAGRTARMRVLGPQSLGCCSPVSGFNATPLSLPLASGSTALIAQSSAIASAAIDWAVGRSIGFSWFACTGTELDVDVADLLDYAALDPRTHGVVLQLSRIRNARKFMSAARACARLKPVVVLQTPATYAAPPDPVYCAAFRRAGLVECESLSALFDALQALERLPRLESDRIALCATDADFAAVAARALVASGLTPVPVPDVPADPGAPTVEQEDATTALRVLQSAATLRDTAATLYAHAPSPEAADDKLAAAIAASTWGGRLCVAWIGLATARPAWQTLADAGIAVYPSVNAAARALAYCRSYQITKELLTQTPAIAQIEVEAHRVGERIADCLENGHLHLTGTEAARLLRHYGLRTRYRSAGGLVQVHVRAILHAELGMVLELRPQAGGIQAGTSIVLLPLDDCIARRALERAGLNGVDEPQFHELRQRAAPLLIRIGELLIDQPHIESLELSLCIDEEHVALAPGSEIRLSPAGGPAAMRLALAPYPAQLTHCVDDGDGTSFLYRAVLPTDEAALIALLTRIPQEDIRRRFFSYIREFTHAMAARMTQIDYDRELSIVVMPEKTPGTIVGIATLIADSNGDAAEFAILVHQDFRLKGIARHLMECLLERARSRHVGTVFGEVLRENSGMRQLARSLGFVEQPCDAQTVHVEWRAEAEKASGDPGLF